MNSRNTFLLLLVIAGAATRIIPHPYNFTAITAIALFAGARFENKLFSFLVPVSSMLIVDLFLGINSRETPAVYFSFALITGIGILLSRHTTVARLGAATIGSSLLFYLITNYAVWPGNRLYTQDLPGLFDSYIAGIPFLRNQVIGDLFYVTMLFGGFAWIESRYPSLLSKKAKS